MGAKSPFGISLTPKDRKALECRARAYTDPYTPSYVEHKYVLSSLQFFDAGGFPISLKVTWAAAFRVNGGGWQELGPITGSFTSRHQVRASWPVLVNNASTVRTAP